MFGSEIKREGVFEAIVDASSPEDMMRLIHEEVRVSLVQVLVDQEKEKITMHS